jgi:hypothetical protein
MTICPYKWVMFGITVLLALVVAQNQVFGEEDQATKKKKMKKVGMRKKHDDYDSDDSETEEEVEEDEEPALKRWLHAGTEWFNTFLTTAKETHPTAYRTAYLTMISLLVLFHFEIFSGGSICRALFKPAENVSDVEAALGLAQGAQPESVAA